MSEVNVHQDEQETTKKAPPTYVIISNGFVNNAPHPPANAPMIASLSKVELSKSISALFNM